MICITCTLQMIEEIRLLMMLMPSKSHIVPLLVFCCCFRLVSSLKRRQLLSVLICSHQVLMCDPRCESSRDTVKTPNILINTLITEKQRYIISIMFSGVTWIWDRRDFSKWTTADNSSGLSQVSAEAWFHAAARPHVRPVLRDAGGWSDRRHLQRPGVCSFRPTDFHTFLQSKNYLYRSEILVSTDISQHTFFRKTCLQFVGSFNESGLNDSLVNLSQCLFGYYLFV